MAQPLIARRIGQSLATLPDWRDVAECLLAIFVFGGGAYVVAQGQGWVGGVADTSWLAMLLPFFVPALVEETVFRAALLPRQSEVPIAPWGPAIFALLLYVAWHPLNAWLFMPAARPVFFDPMFLLAAAVLGAVASILYLRSQSLWTPVIFHGAIVTGWGLAGGPQFTQSLLS